MTSDKRYINLSLYRIIAALLIIQFHIIYIIYPFNVEGGYLLSKFIQGFATLSGFLYSQKIIENKKEFYKKNFIKIILPALVCVAFMLSFNVGYLLIAKNYSFSSIFLGYTALNGNLLIQPGNYYYIFYLLFCYLITPFLQKDNILKKIIIISVISIEVIVSFITRGFPIIVTCYIVGYFIGKNKFDYYVNPRSGDDVERLLKWIFIGFLAYSSTRNPLLINTKNAFLNHHLQLMTFNFSSAVFGISIFFIIIYLLRGLNAYKADRLFLFTDGLTLYIYLLNQTFMVGATNITRYVDTIESKTFLVYLFTIFFALILYLLFILIFKKSSLNKCNTKNKL